MKNRNIIIVLGLLLSITACSSGSQMVKENRDVVVKEADLGDYKKIDAKGSVEVRYEQTRTPYFRIEVNEDILTKVVYRVEKGTLFIYNEGKIAPSHYIVYTGSSDLEEIKLSGSGDLLIKDGLKVKSLEVSLAGDGDVKIRDVEGKRIKSTLKGSGNIELAGKVEELQASLNGSGDIEAFALITESSSATLKGSGDIEVYADKKLKAEINGSGNISYKGAPDISTKIKGSGNVARRQ